PTHPAPPPFPTRRSSDLTSIPIILRLLERREAMLKKYMAMGEEQTRRAENELNSIQNSLKVYRGQLAGLKDQALMGRKMMDEMADRKSTRLNSSHLGISY